jgi:hypothetical protein
MADSQSESSGPRQGLVTSPLINIFSTDIARFIDYKYTLSYNNTAGIVGESRAYRVIKGLSLTTGTTLTMRVESFMADGTTPWPGPIIFKLTTSTAALDSSTGVGHATYAANLVQDLNILDVYDTAISQNNNGFTDLGSASRVRSSTTLFPLFQQPYYRITNGDQITFAREVSGAYTLKVNGYTMYTIPQAEPPTSNSVAVTLVKKCDQIVNLTKIFDPPVPIPTSPPIIITHIPTTAKFYGNSNTVNLTFGNPVIPSYSYYVLSTPFNRNFFDGALRFTYNSTYTTTGAPWNRPVRFFIGPVFSLATAPGPTDPTAPPVSNISESDFENFALSTNVDPTSGLTLSTSNNPLDFSANAFSVYTVPGAQTVSSTPYRQLNNGDTISIHALGGVYVGLGGAYRFHINGHVWFDVPRALNSFDNGYIGIWKKSNQTINLAIV